MLKQPSSCNIYYKITRRTVCKVGGCGLLSCMARSLLAVMCLSRLPDCDAARQQALNGAPVAMCEDAKHLLRKINPW